MTDKELTRRLEKLERDNRRFKRFGAAALVLAAALGAIYAARPVPDSITSHKFVLLDSQGRARLTISTPRYAGGAVGMNSDDPAIWLSDDKGTDRAILTTDSLRFADAKGKPLATYAATDPVPEVIKAHEFDAVDDSGKVRVAMSISPSKVGMPGLALYDRSGNPVAGLTTMRLPTGGRDSWLQISSPQGRSVVTMGVTAGDPSIDISDADGFRMVLGSTLERDSSADSIVMFGNDKQHHVIWRAP